MQKAFIISKKKKPINLLKPIRLNSVLEPERKVLLAEKIDSSETEVVTAHPQFR